MKVKQAVSIAFMIILLLNVGHILDSFLTENFAGVQAQSTNWLDLAWSNRAAITINNTKNTNTLTDYQLEINVTYLAPMKSNFSDLRFTSGDGVSALPYWLERYVPAAYAIVWVKIASIPASGSTTIYLYYGNTAAASTSNGKATFDFFDDFESQSASGWTDKAAIPANTADATAAVYDDKLYVFGGYSNTASDTLKNTYEYNPETNTWAKKADMPTARWGAIAVQYNGQIYILGGQTAPQSQPPPTSTGTPQSVTRYSGNPLTSIPQYGATGSVHPDVVYFPNGLDGYKYWMMYTPYPPQAKENPSMIRSNDGVTWTATGITNPIIKAGTLGAFNDLENPDPDCIYVADYKKWFMVWDPGDQATDSRKIALAYSSDGKTWTQYNGARISGNTNPIILSGSDSGGAAWERLGSVSKLSCPALLYQNGVFYLYYVEEATGNNRGKAGLATFTWDNTANSVKNLARDPNNPIINLPQNNQFLSGIGHIDVAISPTSNDYWLYGVRQTADSSSFELVQLTSTDRVTWSNQGSVLSHGPSGAWDDYFIYRSCPVVDQTGKIILFNNAIQLYYSGWSDSQHPMIGLATISLASTSPSPSVGILGNTNTAGNNYWGGDIEASRFQFTGATGAYNGSIYVYFSSTAGASNNKAAAAIYDQNGVKLAQSAQVSGLTTGWQTFQLNGNFTLTQGSNYYLVSHAPNGNNGKLTSGSQNQGSWKSVSYTGTLPSSLLPFSGQENYAYSIYLTYTNPANTTDNTNPQPQNSYNEVYNPANDTWTQKADVPPEIAYQGLMSVLYNGSIHLFYRNYHYSYNPATDNYTRLADVPTSRTWGTCAVVGTKIYVIGGCLWSGNNQVGASNVNEAYDPATDTWQTKPAMPASLYGITRETPVIDGKIYVTHGLDAIVGNFYSTTYVYDPAASTWQQKSSASHPRDGIACGVIGGKLYTVGGRADLSGPYGLTYNEMYDPTIDTGVAAPQWSYSSAQNAYRSTSAASQGNNGLLINDNLTGASSYAEHSQSYSQVVVDIDWDMTTVLGTGFLQPQGRILLVDPSKPQYGTLYLYNDGGTPRFKWYTGTFATLQTASWNSWYHITIVWAGANSKVIINGTQYSVTAQTVLSDRIRLDTARTELTREYFDNVVVRRYTTVEPVVTFNIPEAFPPT